MMAIGFREPAGFAKIALFGGLLWSMGVCAQSSGGDPIAVSYAQMHKVPLAEAKSRLARQPEIARLQQRLQRELPDTFAGLIIEHRPSYRVVVRFTGDAKAQLARYTRDPVFVAEVAPRPLELLRSVQDEVGEQLNQAGIAFESGLDLKSSQVDVYVLDSANASKRLSGVLSLASFVKVHKVPALMTTTATVVGGNRVDGSTRRCTTGFNVVNAARELGIVTAGHCDNSLTYIGSPNVNLVFQTEQDAGSFDVQWHKQTTVGAPKEQPNEIKIVGGPQASMRITSETPSSALSLGTPVCKNGLTTNYTCGEIADMNAQTNYNGTIGSYLRVHNANNLVMTEEGDSGGPVFGTDTAYGIVHGRGGPGTPTHDDMYFMPVERFSALGVSVVTVPFSLDSLANVSGPHNTDIPAQVFYKGFPRFPVKRVTKNVTCAPGWNCSEYNGTYTTNTASPLTFNFRCTVGASQPTATFQWRTTLVGADGVTTNAIDHTSTCTTVTPAAAAKGDAGVPTITIVP